MKTDTSEKGLEKLIVDDMTSAGWHPGNPVDYDRSYALDLVQLRAFITETQHKLVEALDLQNDSPTRQKFLARLQGEITKRGVIDVLRKGINHGQHNVDLFYGTPSVGNEKAAERFAQNRFSVTRQLRYSLSDDKNALDLGLFINGLPIATFELKNNLTKQTVADAIEQYKKDRDPRELIFQFGRCMAHFAVDDAEVRFCTDLKGKWFLPFNKGWNDGAGNPPNPDGLKTDYLWKNILTKSGLTDVIENYAQIVEERNKKTGKVSKKQIFPRYHQLDVVRKLLVHAGQHGVGNRYLIEHSAGSGKSNSIAWLAHQLTSVKRDGKEVFDTIIVVTDRTILDDQIKGTIKQFDHLGATVGHADHSGDLRRFIQQGKKIVISTVQKFPFIIDEIGSEHRSRSFALIIDEAHSSQGGRTSAAVSSALSQKGKEEDDETIEDEINRIMEAKKLQPNVSYFAFTATPKNKTLEMFGTPYFEGTEKKFRPEQEIDELVGRYLGGANRDQLDPILDACVSVYNDHLDEDGQVRFKGKAKAFARAYGFLSAILPFTNADWEKLSIFLNFLVPKLPAPKEEDLSKGILEAIDMDSYRVEKKAAVRIQLPDEDGTIEPMPMSGVSGKAEPEIDRLSNILKFFNEQFGNIEWVDGDRVRRMITEEIPAKVAADKAYQNAMRNSDKENAKVEHGKALERVMTAVLNDDTQLFSKFQDDADFRRWLTQTMFAMTYKKSAAEAEGVAAQ